MENNPAVKNIGEKKVTIFISYSSRDIDLMNELLTQLKVLTITDKQIEFWQDGLLEPGLRWDEEIKAKLHTAHIVPPSPPYPLSLAPVPGCKPL
jgi:hypothetical protein